jgi:hypothetical protein
MVGAERARWGERVSIQSSEIITRDLRGQAVPNEKGMWVLVSRATVHGAQTSKLAER